MSFYYRTVLVPENVYGRLKKITGNGLAAGCQLFLRIFFAVYPVSMTSLDIAVYIKIRRRILKFCQHDNI